MQEPWVKMVVEDCFKRVAYHACTTPNCARLDEMSFLVSIFFPNLYFTLYKALLTSIPDVIRRLLALESRGYFVVAGLQLVDILCWVPLPKAFIDTFWLCLVGNAILE